jgi:hypothetical protein
MNWKQPLDSLDLDDNRILNKKVDAVAALERKSLIVDRDRNLDRDKESPPLQLMSQAGAIGGFEQARTEGFVHSEAGIDNLPRAILDRVGKWRGNPQASCLRVFVVQAFFILTVSSPCAEPTRPRRPELSLRRGS